MKDDKTKLELELCEYLDSLDTEALLASMIAKLCFMDFETKIEGDVGINLLMIEILAFYSIPRFGNNLGSLISVENIIVTYDLLTKLLNKKTYQSLNKIKATYFESLSSRMAVKYEFIRGEAYPSQTKKRILEVQGKFDKEFEKLLGISPSRLMQIIFQLVKYQEELLQENEKQCIQKGIELENDYQELRKEKKIGKLRKDDIFLCGYFSVFNRTVPRSLPMNLENIKDLHVSNIESSAIKKFIGISRESFKLNDNIREFPLYIISSGKVLLSDLSNCLDVIWNKFDLAAKKSCFYDSYQKYKSNWLEQQMEACFKRIFPNTYIYRTMDYPDPNKVTSSTAEMDMVIQFGPFLLLIEAKAKQFRLEALQGDLKKIKQDIYQNAKDAFNQTLRVINYLKMNNQILFIERKTKKELLIHSCEIKRIFSIAVSLNYLGGVATEFDSANELNLFKKNLYPFSVGACQGK